MTDVLEEGAEYIAGALVGVASIVFLGPLAVPTLAPFFGGFMAAETAVGLSIGAGFAAAGGLAYMAATTVGALTSIPELPKVGQASPTYGKDFLYVTIAEGIPIGRAYGLLRLAGNVIRTNEATDADLRMIVAHCMGEASAPLAYDVNEVLWDGLGISGTTTYTFHSGTTSQFADTRFPSVSGVSSPYHGLAYTAFTLPKDTNQVGNSPNVTVTGHWQKCTPIGGPKGAGAKIWSNNPAVVMYDWYVNVEGFSVEEMDNDKFRELETYCDDTLSGNAVPIMPPLSTNTVKATSEYWPAGLNRHMFSFDNRRSLTGDSSNRQWFSAAGSTTNQRINVDMGQAYVINKVVIENAHTSGVNLTYGVQNFSIQGSNEPADFADASWASTGNWVDVAVGKTAQQHVAADTEDPQEFSFSNTIAYRYISFKFANNWGSAISMAVRRITIYGYMPKRYTFDYIFDSKITANDAKKIIWRSFNGCCIRSQGKIRPVWESAKNVSHNFTLANIVKGSFSWWRPKAPNIIRINYIESYNKWQKDCVELRRDDDISQNGEILYEEEAWYIANGSMARRRCQFVHDKGAMTDACCRLGGFSDSSHLEIYDRVTVTHPLPGWTAKDFIVRSKQEDTLGRCVFELEAYYEGIYLGEEAEPQKGYMSYLPNPFECTEHVSSLAASATYYWNSDGQYIPRVLVTYTPPDALDYSRSAIYVGTDGVNYSFYGYDGSNGSGFYVVGPVAGFQAGDTLYVKAVAINSKGIEAGLSLSPSTNVAIMLPVIQTALDDAPVSGGRLFLPKGSYTLTSSVSVPDKPINFVGAGRSLTQITCPSGSTGFIFYNKTKTFKMSSMKIIGGADAASPSPSPALIHCYGDVNNSMSLFMEDIHFNPRDPNQYGATGQIGIRIHDGSAGVIKASACMFEGGADAIRGGTYEDGQTDWTGTYAFENNKFIGQMQRAILLWGGGDLTISGNVIQDFRWTGITIAASPNNCNISNNIIVGGNDAFSGSTDMYGMFLAGNYLNVIGNSITMADTRSSATHTGIFAVAVNTCKMDGNIIKISSNNKYKSYGIYDFSSTRCSIQGNAIAIANSNATRDHYGIFCWGTRGIVSGNWINMTNTGANDYGIYLPVGGDYYQGYDNTVDNVIATQGLRDLGSSNNVTVKEV
jgi:parallel beta-helix repeat protein